VHGADHVLHRGLHVGMGPGRACCSHGECKTALALPPPIPTCIADANASPPVPMAVNVRWEGYVLT
jgi:hypothetical protein